MYKGREERKYDSRMISHRRVAKVTAGAKRLRFSALVVAGDRKGKVGLGLGRGADVRQAVEKGAKKAERVMTQIEIIGDTVPHECTKKYKSAKLVVKPAKPGTGVICATSIRSIIELTGIENVYVKQLGSNDPIANSYCLMSILKSMKSERVLARSQKMQGRIEVKKELEKERKKRELLVKKSKPKFEKRGSNQTRRNFQTTTKPAPKTEKVEGDKK